MYNFYNFEANLTFPATSRKKTKDNLQTQAFEVIGIVIPFFAGLLWLFI